MKERDEEAWKSSYFVDICHGMLTCVHVYVCALIYMYISPLTSTSQKTGFFITYMKIATHFLQYRFILHEIKNV